MRQPLHPRCSALRTIIAATIMIIANATTAWAQYSDYMLYVESNYDESSSIVIIPVSYDWSLTENNYHYILKASYFEEEFKRGNDHFILGWATSPKGEIVYEPNSTIVLKENPTTIYTIWDDKEEQPVGISYIDANGNEAHCPYYTELDGSETTLINNVDTNNDGTSDQGWYVVNSNISFDHTLTLDGDIHLILCDDKTMSVKPQSDHNTYAVGADTDANLTIYGQTNQTGRLEAYSNYVITILINGNYTQHGGDVFLTNTFDGNSRALFVNTTVVVDSGNITLSRGKLTASAISPGGTAIEAISNVNILGGQLDAQGGTEGEYADGIRAGGNITLGWTTAKDRINASSYHVVGTVKIVKGQALVEAANGNNYAIGDGNALSYGARSAFAGKTLKPALLLTDNADNNAQVAALDEFETTAILQNRTLYKDGDWNTLCLPFNVSTASGTLSGDNVEAKVLRASDSGLSGSTLTLNFDNAPSTIPAGTPFIVKWDNTGESIENPVFQGVTIDNSADAINRMTQTSTDGTVSFKGTYVWQEYTQENQSILLLGAGNQLFWPQPSGDTNPSIGACRAYFELSDGQSAREFVLNFGETSSLPQPLQKEGSQAGAWYTLDGRKLDGQKPIAKGMYIVNGRKVIIK